MTWFTRRMISAAALLGVAVLAASPLPAQAQAKNGDRFKDWVFRCTEDPNNPAIGSCFIVQTVMSNETQKRVMLFGVSTPPGEEGPRAVIIVPLGVDLRPGIELSIDDGEPLKKGFFFCLPDGCQVHIRMDEAMVEGFKKGSKGTVTFRTLPEGRPVSVPVSLAGFTSAFNALQ